jgi:hypothetical protein
MIGEHGEIEKARTDTDADTQQNRTTDMITSIIMTGVVLGALGYALRPGRHGDMIVSRPYNNRYNDASGAREDHLG